MTKASYPNKPGDYEIDGISIIILPDKIIIDTGGKARNTGNQPAYAGRKMREKAEGSSGKKGDMWNNLLDNCQDIVMGKKRV